MPRLPSRCRRRKPAGCDFACSGRKGAVLLTLSHDRFASLCRGSGSRSRPQPRSGGACRDSLDELALVRPRRRKRSCSHLGKVRADGARIVDILDVLSKTYGSGDSEGAQKLTSLQPHAPGRRRRFYLAVLIERSKPAPRYDISLRRNRALRVNGPAFPPHADWSPLHRSTAAEPSCARCKRCTRPATRMTIGRHYKRRPSQDLLIWGCRFHFRLSFNSGSISDIAALRICARTRAKG